MDAKLQEVLLDYGLEGYGLYFYCLEMIVNKISSDNLAFELEHDARIIARNTGSTPKKVEEMMRKFVDLGLFENSGTGGIRCIKLLNRLDSSMTSNKKMRVLIQDAKDLHSHDGVMISHDEVMGLADSVMQEEKRIDKKRIEDKTSSDLPKNGKVTTGGDFVKPKKKQIPYQDIVDLYHEKLKELPQIVELNQTRRGYIKKLYLDKLPDREAWGDFFDYVKQSDFLMGRLPPQPNRKTFKANLEWITKPANFLKILEGFYNGE